VRTVQEAVNAMLISSKLSAQHWDDAVGQHKWNPKAEECILVGYCTASKNYKLFRLKEKKYISQSEHVKFEENSISQINHSISEELRIMDEDEISIIEEITQSDPSSRRSSPLKSVLKSPPNLGPSSNAGHTPPATPKNKGVRQVNTSDTEVEENKFKELFITPNTSPSGVCSTASSENDERELFTPNSSVTSTESLNSKNLSWSDQMDLEDEGFKTPTEEQPKPEIRKSGRVKTNVVKFQAGFPSKFTEQISDPDTYQEAMKSRYAEDWKGAMDDEVNNVRQPADILTKAVVKENLVQKREMMGIKRPPEKETVKQRALACLVKIPPERETTKRKAPPSISTDPKRPCLLWTLAILWFLIALSGATSTCPIIWRKSLQPVIAGFNAFTMKLQLISPCSLLPAEGIKVQIYRKMTKECEYKYEELFRNQLKKICPEDKITFGRQKRFVFTAGFIVIVAVVSAGVGLAGYAVSRTYALETRQEEIKTGLGST
ncbi:unnamed protein product, partial [Allacma fusca]